MHSEQSVSSLHREPSAPFLCRKNKLFVLCTRIVDLYRTSLCTKNKVVLLCTQRTKDHIGYFSMHGHQLICFFSVHSCAMRIAKKQFVSNTMSAKRTHFFFGAQRCLKQLKYEVEEYNVILNKTLFLWWTVKIILLILLNLKEGCMH